MRRRDKYRYAARNVLRTLFPAYNLFLIAWLVLRNRQDALFWWVWIVNGTVPWFFLPLPLFIVASLFRRRWTVGLILPVGLFLVLYGNLFLPRWPSASASRDEHSFRVMTFNVLFENYNYAGVAELVSRQSPDLVAFEELQPAAAQAFRQILGRDYPYRALEPRDGPYGIGIFSRWPLADAGVVVERPWGVGGLFAKVATPCGVPLRLVAMHPPPTIPQPSRAAYRAEVLRTVGERRREIRQSLDYLAADSGPAVLLGDFNLTDQHQTYQVITKDYGYKDSFREAGWGLGFTFPARGSLFPFIRIDYVFHSPDIEASAAHVLPDNNGSDHRPLLVDLNLRCPVRPMLQH
ncbi:MAG: hypothetical protein GXP41_04165 [Chloroflexi bacterium]|nr:hypothetical protein [Chloroflexota bacterium]